ncbi:MAG: hypothetical protein A2268_13405 [Candidatus Raymondbacteria bacterium RifOxyA12_full_50_37]|uniref:PEGA domain-containing protein n=1 Tax=Candidatus Raymondbacteria bacterium RIFOXYD12_FULL_49_13 TaxID=1817890 RepID=A0A1F7FDY6_UNCRA|nr:MAG: hypothetical protein A2268_13405 [Candidatus Raymondbacteria bacterium RifOxyA12_full_50_37]OGJ91815.1 MAG: hypothetical protein A2248_00295 [Candidatus Raymondbacteria bacterium RIFOXYA2_FULL_49_16]OGK00757.1 MAG: hypothetical protein A2350_18895 [Candidatus Raymondbacteria bacterium RifOxyB12_full_50_8]OGK04702.1 MAG: hypothetical protein A2519_18650 [Candidatus Raymondbacteria bacterium RIFOXYD12_FULL_49_13]OGK07906.1 MAG: hypothetical protein A2487_17355 [Candidatus Raymondbacteria 
MKHVLFFCFAACINLFAAGEKIGIAVNDLQAMGVDAPTAAILSERLRTELLNSGAFRVMERGQMDNILKEQGFQQSGACSDNACIIEMGQLLGVSEVVVGTAGKVAELYTVSVRMIDVATGEILLSENEECECPFKTVLNETIGNLASKLAKKASPYASLSISSAPQGATVALNNEKRGTTPLSFQQLEPGTYTLSLSLLNYQDTVFSVSLKKGENIECAPALRMSDAYQKTVKSKKTRKAWTVRGIAGGLAIVALAGGIYFNSQYNSAYNDYKAIHTVDNLDAEYQKVETQATRRNVCYGISGGIAVLGFAFSLTF